MPVGRDDSVGGGAVAGEGVGTGVLVGAALGLGLGDGSPPTPDGLRGLSTLSPTAPMAITTTAAIATLAKVLMVGNLRHADEHAPLWCRFDRLEDAGEHPIRRAGRCVARRRR